MRSTFDHAAPALERLAGAARSLLGVQCAAITLLDGNQHRSLVQLGPEPRETFRLDLFRHLTIRRCGPFVVNDARGDDRFSSRGDVNGNRGIGFYAGYPIESADGYRVGALCA